MVLPSLAAEGVLFRVPVMVRALLAHLAAEGLLNAPRVLGSLELLFNPTGLLTSVAQGFQDLLALPLAALEARSASQVPPAPTSRLHHGQEDKGHVRLASRGTAECLRTPAFAGQGTESVRISPTRKPLRRYPGLLYPPGRWTLSSLHLCTACLLHSEPMQRCASSDSSTWLAACWPQLLPGSLACGQRAHVAQSMPTAAVNGAGECDHCCGNCCSLIQCRCTLFAAVPWVSRVHCISTFGFGPRGLADGDSLNAMQFAAGLGLGSASLLRHLSSWTLTSVSGFSGAVANVLQRSLAADSSAR